MQASFIDTVRLDAETRTRLLTLKKRTGIGQWNILCRWAFCLSLSDATPVRHHNETDIGAVEMAWQTFAGHEEVIYRHLLITRCQTEHGKVDRELLSSTLRHHIFRGASRLAAAGGVKSVTELLHLAQTPNGVAV